MKIDPELCREILLYVEENDGPPTKVEIAGYSAQKMGYNVKQLVLDGLLEAIDATHRGNLGAYLVKNLTPKGHRFLHASRDEKVWKRTLRALEKSAIPITIELLRIALFDAIKH